MKWDYYYMFEMLYILVKLLQIVPSYWTQHTASHPAIRICMLWKIEKCRDEK